MPYETIEVKPATAAIGAEISGVDLGRPLGNQQFQEVHDALMAHQVIFFRDQQISVDQQRVIHGWCRPGFGAAASQQLQDRRSRLFASEAGLLPL